jgi:hypothetical protein
MDNEDSMISGMTVSCPYCGEMIDVVIDASAGEQDYYEDCSVCCRPIRFCLLTGMDGSMYVDVKREDET